MNMDRIKQIDIENNIWIIYLFIIGLSFYSNKLEKDYFINNNNLSKEKYRKINILIFSILIIVYSYFEKESLKGFLNKSQNLEKRYLDTLSFIGSSLVLISGIIFLYIVINDTELIEEVAFN